MNLDLQEVNHILKALNNMSSYNVARAREQIDPGVTNHEQLVQKLKDYKLRLQWKNGHMVDYHDIVLTY